MDNPTTVAGRQRTNFFAGVFAFAPLQLAIEVGGSRVKIPTLNQRHFSFRALNPPDWCANRAALRSAKSLEAVHLRRCGRPRKARSRDHHQAPERPEDQEVVAPVVDVDDGALAGDTQEGGVDHVVSRLPGRAHKHKTQSPNGGDEREAEIGEAAQPAARHDGIEEGVVRVLAEIALGELQRPDAERPVEHQIEAENVAPEAPEMAEVVVLVEGGALLEKISDLADRQ